MNLYPNAYYDRVYESLVEIESSLHGTLQPQVAIGGILELLAHFLQFHQGRVLINKPESMSLTIAYAHDLSQSQISHGIYRAGEGLTGKLLENETPILALNVFDNPVYLGRVNPRSELPYPNASYIAFPIRNDQHQLLGACAFISGRYVPEQCEQDLRLLTIATNTVGLCLQRISANDHQD